MEESFWQTILSPGQLGSTSMVNLSKQQILAIFPSSGHLWFYVDSLVMWSVWPSFFYCDLMGADGNGEMVGTHVTPLTPLSRQCWLPTCNTPHSDIKAQWKYVCFGAPICCLHFGLTCSDLCIIFGYYCGFVQFIL